ncbi:hypothetical protein CEK26_005213 [Fusarium fujikuroi]|nr:hypothetical protein CEK27_005217 [Fusarium fujikuroi]QGI92144.1 hypothetical protein CEK26_005213 [Fusarium fujikuroi]
MTASKPASRGRTKVKTGCATCRIRKIKCDEAKPFCEKCAKTGRKCDGYESVFRPFPSKPQQIGKPDAAASGHDCAEGNPPLSTGDLNRYFSTKTIFDVELSCNEEAEEVLQASLTNDSIRHALLSLRALRGNLESKKEAVTSETDEQQRLSYNYGLQQYSEALTSLASNLAYPSPDSLKSALLCCQVLISVEQVRGNFSAMGLHIIRGLNILREYRARPYLTTDGLMSARHSGLPSLDVFIIKLFAAPCRFTEQQTSESSSVMTPPVETRSDRKLAPNMRAELTKTATSTIALLENTTKIQSEEKSQSLLLERQDLLDGLESWLGALESLQQETQPGEPESTSDNFLRILSKYINKSLNREFCSQHIQRPLIVQYPSKPPFFFDLLSIHKDPLTTPLITPLTTPSITPPYPIMHFLLLGATGRTGKYVVSELLSQHHTAVALVRDASKVASQPGLTVVTGSPLSKDDIRRALTAAPGLVISATIITLNTVRKSDSPFAAQVSPPRFLADSCANACAVLKEAGIKRIAIMSTAGVGDSWGKLPWVSRAFMGWTNIKYALEDHNLLDKEIRSTGMDWTLVRAVRLEFGKETDKEVETLGSAGEGMGMSDSVTPNSVARFLVKVAVERSFVKEAVVVRN